MAAMNYVIGSGPAGVSCAKALLARGAAVTLVDIGHVLEPSAAHVVAGLAAQEPSSWSVSNIAALRRRHNAGVRGVAKKLAFGSDFPYRLPRGEVSDHFVDANIATSRAQGGL